MLPENAVCDASPESPSPQSGHGPANSVSCATLWNDVDDDDYMGSPTDSEHEHIDLDTFTLKLKPVSRFTPNITNVLGDDNGDGGIHIEYDIEHSR